MLGRSIAGPRPYLTFCTVRCRKIRGEQLAGKTFSAAVRTHGKVPNDAEYALAMQELEAKRRELEV